MKFLILTITAGHGHNQTAKAISDYIKITGNQALVMDAYEYINPVLKESVSMGYLISTSISPNVYGKFYRLAEKKEKNSSKLTLNNITTSILSKKIINFLNQYQPDAIICTHVYAAKLISVIDRVEFNCPTVGIVTDFTIHPFWDETNLDYYVLANDLLTYQATLKEIKEEKTLPFGIPINMKFATKHNKLATRQVLGLENKPTILVMSGSMGFGNVYKVLEKLCNLPIDFQIVSVCGNNKSQKKKIDKGNFSKPIINYGFTDKIDLLMDASDVIVTKPGGLTVSEALAKEIPMILISPIPGQEERNREFLVNNGVAMCCSATAPVDEVISQFFKNSNLKESMQNNISYLKKPNSTKELVDFLIKKVNQHE